MLKSKVIELLKSLSIHEKEEFYDILKTHFFNKRKKLIEFYEIIIEYYPSFEHPDFKKEFIFKKLYPGSEFNSSLIRNHLSDLYEIGKNFLILKNLEKDKFDKKIFLLNELSERKLNNILEKELKLFGTELGELKNIDGNYLLHCFQLESDKFNYNIVNKKLSGKISVKEDIDILIKRGEYLTGFFIMELMKGADNLNKYSKIFNYELKDNVINNFIDNDIESLITFMKENKNELSYIFEIYYYLWKSFQDFNNEEYFSKLKDAVNKNKKKFSIDENHFLYGKMIEYLILKNKDYNLDNKYDLELIIVYDFFLKNELYKSRRNEFLMVDLFRNILINGIRSGDLQWTEKFIKNNIEKLHPDYRHNMNFDKAQEYLSMVLLDIFVFKFDVKNYQIRISYEFGQYETTLQLIDSFKHFLFSHEMVSEVRRTAQRNFIKYLTSILKHKLNGKGDDPGLIIKEVNKNLNEKILKKWLIEKANEL